MTKRDGERTRWTDEMLDELADSVSGVKDSVSGLRESVSEVKDSVEGLQLTA
jgi:archaellum component FlaC